MSALYSSDKPNTNANPYFLQTSEWSAAAKDASLVLKSLPYLEGVSVRVVSPLDIPAEHPFVPELFSANILMLEIHGQLAIHGKTPSFVHLQTLSLHLFYFDWLFEFPALPQLHTLRLIETYSWSGIYDDLLPRAKLPSLRSLQLYCNTFSTREFGNKFKVSFPEVRDLHLVGEFETSCFKYFAGSPSLDRLQHLVIGNIETLDHPFGDWEFPSTLEALSVVVDLCHGTHTLSVLEKTLRRNKEVLPTIRLRSVAVNVCWAPETEADSVKLGLVKTAFDELRNGWRRYVPDIEFKFKEIGMCGFTCDGQFDSWIELTGPPNEWILGRPDSPLHLRIEEL